jgi:uncharacterized damage-inducible protein DinB
MIRTMICLCAAAFLPLAAGAQQRTLPAAATTATVQAAVQSDASPVANATRAILERRTKPMIAAAEAMPADKYSYKPTPDQMSFAHLVLHIAGTNNFLCSSISGSPAPADDKLTETDSKEKLIASMKASFDYCSTALAKADDSKLAEQVPFFGNGKISRAGAMIVLSSAFADHYGMEAMYLRLNGITPPTAQPKKD